MNGYKGEGESDSKHIIFIPHSYPQGSSGFGDG